MKTEYKTTEQDYYASIKYRGSIKYYYVSNLDSKGHLRVEYIDYTPNREWDGVWIKDGLSKIVDKFDSTTEVYKYFTELKSNWNKLINEDAEKTKKYYKLNHTPFIGTLNVLKCYKKALKITENPLGISIKID